MSCLPATSKQLRCAASPLAFAVATIREADSIGCTDRAFERETQVGPIYIML